MTRSENVKPKPGDRVVLTEVPPGFLDDLPSEDQQAINEVIGKPLRLNEYDKDGRAELEFKDRNGNLHFIYVRPEFIGAPSESELRFDTLQRLIKKSDIISLRRELNSGMNPNLSNRFSWTLLMLAALEGKLSIGELLISKGAEVNATNDFGETALSLAAHRGHTRFIRALLANRASANCRPHGSSLADWLKVSSGLSQERIESVLDLIREANSRLTR
jgi:ankyrin repeat protein